MSAMLVIVVIVSLFCAILGALIALRLQHGYFQRAQVQQRGWERSQEGHLQDWEHKQERQIEEAEARLGMKVQHVQKIWHEWEAKDQARVQELAAQHTEVEARMHVQSELARLTRIEDTPLLLETQRQHQCPFHNWRPPMLQGANLSELDLSHRYLGQADLRNAQLKNTNFFMADLSGAFLTGANLEGADLSGANLIGADLRGATLSDANLIVADLQGAILIGADLRGVRNLSPKQLYTAVYDSTTRLDAKVDLTMPRLRSVEANGSSALPTTDDSTAKVATIQPASPAEPASIADVESSHPLFTGGLEPLIPQGVEPPLASNDSYLDPQADGLLANTSENTHTEEFDAANSTREYNGTRRAKAS